MTFLVKSLVLLGCAVLLFGFLSFDFIPERILAGMSPEQRAHTDRSIVESDWITRGFYGVGSGGILLVAALVLHGVRVRARRKGVRP